MNVVRSLAGRLAYRLVARAPAGAVGRARTSRHLAPLLERGLAAVGVPLYGTVVPIAHGPAAGLRLVAERRSLVWISGAVEPEVQEVLVRYLRTSGTFLDVGSSIGFFTLLAARIVGAEGAVVAFEPQPAAASSLRRNAALNGFETVTVVEAAVSSVPGHVVLEGVGKATARVVDGGADGMRVDCTSLDAYLADRSDLVPELVKIDVEGHEADVLAGMQESLLAHSPALVIEWHGEAAPVVAALARAGYTVSALGSGTSAGHLLARP